MFENVDWTPLIQALITALTVLVLTLKGPLAEFLAAQAEERLSRVSDSTRWILSDLAREAVQTAERLGTNGAEKKSMAVTYMTKSLAAFGLTIDEEAVELAIEAAVTSLKDRKE